MQSLLWSESPRLCASNFGVAADTFARGLTRGFFCQYTTKNIYVVKICQSDC